MIDVLNNLLVQLLTTSAPPVLTATQISFHPPDKDWRNAASHMSGTALNIYLVELYQNLDLRSNERFAELTAAGVEQTRAPLRLNCRYLISAWSPAEVTPMTDPAIDESVVLYEVARTLLENSPLDAREIYAPGPLPALFPDEMVSPTLPTIVAAADPFAKLSDFWMRMDTIWKPVVELRVTLPVAYAPRAPAPAVTTVFSEYGTVEHPELEELLVIGGSVRDSSSDDPVPGAWVQLVELDRTVTTTTDGLFIFAGIRRGAYTLEAGAAGRATVRQPIEVPTASGVYDIHVT